MRTRKACLLGAVAAIGSSIVMAPNLYAENNTTQTYNDGGVHNLVGDITVGASGTNNSLDVSNSTNLSNTGSGLIGDGAAANNNSAVVTDGSTWSVNAHLWVGVSGANNTLTLSAGGQITESAAGFAQLGRNTSSTGNQVLVTGAGSKWTMSGVRFDVGFFGGGNSATVSSGGVIQHATDSYVGFASNNNTGIVTGSGSQWTNAGGFSLGESTGATGNQMTVSNGGLLSAAGYFIGNNGFDNTFTIDTGGDVSTTGFVLIGRLSGSNSNDAVITGAGSTLTSGGTFWVGGFGNNNTMTVADSGVVTGTGYTSIGPVGDNNVATVTGTGSQWNSSGIVIGENPGADGNQLVVSAGGKVISSGSLYAGQYGSNNSVTVNSGGEITLVGGLLLVGHNGGTNNSVLVAGEGSLLRADSIAYVGYIGTNSSVVASNGGTLQVNTYNVGTNGGSGTVSANTGGVFQFTTASPSITLGTPGTMTMNGGVISYKGVTGANINNAQVNQIVRSGNNAFRLNNSTNAAIASYTFDSGNVAIYQRLDLINGGHWTSTNLTVGNGGAIRGAGATDVVEITGNFTITRSANGGGDFNLASSQVLFSGGSSHTHLITGADVFAQNLNGFTAANFAYNRFSIGSASDLILVGTGNGAATNALYASWVDLLGNVSNVSQLRAPSNINIYYYLNDPNNAYLGGQTYQLTDWDGSTIGGFLLPSLLPEPSGLLLFAGAGMLLAARRGRRTK